MIAARILGYHSASERKVLLLALDELHTPYTLPVTDGHHFTCFCAMDATRFSVEAISEFCSHMLQLGCAYLCTWGPDCERVHDIMDELIVGGNPPESYIGCVMTTWHAQDSLEEALEFFLFATEPDETYAPHGCDVGLIISVGSTQWAEAIEKHALGRIGTP